MILTGKEIIRRQELGQIIVTPWDIKNVNPNSINVSLHPEMKVYRNNQGTLIGDISGDPLDSRIENFTVPLTIPPQGLVLYPGILYLARTNEYTETHGCVPMLNGRSSTGRLGIWVHVTAGTGDVGFKGTWTLEIVVVTPVRVYPNQRIGQIVYHDVVGETHDYAGKYQGQIDATPTRLFTEMF